MPRTSVSTGFDSRTALSFLLALYEFLDRHAPFIGVKHYVMSHVTLDDSRDPRVSVTLLGNSSKCMPLIVVLKLTSSET